MPTRSRSPFSMTCRRSKEEALTPDEKAKFASWLAAAMRQREYEWLQYRDGVIDRSTWQTYRHLTPQHLGTPRAREWWLISPQFFEPSFVESVSELLARPAPANFFEAIEELEI